MDLAPDPVTERRIDHLMARQTALAGEGRTDDHGLVVALAVSNNLGPGVYEPLLYQADYLTWIHLQQVSFSTGKPDSLSQMAANARNLLLFLSLTGAALVTWVFARFSQEPMTVNIDSEPSPESYYLLGALMSFTNDEGRVYYRVRAERVEQQAEDESFVLDDISVEYVPEIDVHWNITAARGLATANRDTLHLQDNVRLAYAPDVDQEEIIFETDDLRLYPDRFIATSDQRITMRQGDSAVTATGLELNLETDFWKLESDVAINGQRR
jgi:LPS export ABC transporter protein LptC